MAFRIEAHERGALRQAGAVHQFRHARFRERLAAADGRDEADSADEGEGDGEAGVRTAAPPAPRSAS